MGLLVSFLLGQKNSQLVIASCITFDLKNQGHRKVCLASRKGPRIQPRTANANLILHLSKLTFLFFFRSKGREALLYLLYLEVPRFTKGAPRRSGRTKKFIE